MTTACDEPVRSMLIILSDLHLNDGTTGETLSPEAFALFADRLKELAITASWRSDGAYRPIERIDLVLLGDVLGSVALQPLARRPAVFVPGTIRSRRA